MPLSPSQDLEFYLNKKNRLEAAGRLRWFHWFIIIASLVVTLLAWKIAEDTNQERINEQFDREAAQVVDVITERMAHYEDALWGGVAALSTFDVSLTDEAWRNYSEALQIPDKYPGINGIGVIDYVKPDELDSYLKKNRGDRPDFNIFPNHDEGEYWPITFIEPLADNAPAVGLDIAHENNRLTAARAARDTGKSQITGPIALVQDEGKTPGFLFYTPHYNQVDMTTETERRAAFVNLVYAPFVFERLMVGILETDRRVVDLRVSDAGVTLFDEVSGRAIDGNVNGPREIQITKQVYGRTWVFDMVSNEAFDVATENNKPLFVLLLGLAVEILIISLFAILARSNRQSVRFAGEMAQAYEGKSALLSNILDNAIDGVILSDASGRILNFNKASEAMFGYKTDDIIGSNFNTLFQSLKQDFIELNENATTAPTQEMLTSFYTGQMREVKGRRQDGSDIMLEISTTKITERGEILYNTIARDVTRRKTAEAVLQKTMQDLIFSNQDLESFAYVASHDLKSPLRAIDNLSQWIADDMDPAKDEENLKRVELLRSRVSRMEDLLNSLLSYSRAGKQFNQDVRVSVGDLLRDIRSVLNIPDGFAVTFPDSLDDISIPRMPLEQVFHNLISNGIKHHNRDTGEISITGTETQDTYIFQVVDDGPGIDPAFHEKIFDMFQTLRPRDEIEASGMGLALVKKMLLRHGGKVEIESSLGQGSTFIVTFPKTA